MKILMQRQKNARQPRAHNNRPWNLFFSCQKKRRRKRNWFHIMFTVDKHRKIMIIWLYWMVNFNNNNNNNNITNLNWRLNQINIMCLVRPLHSVGYLMIFICNMIMSTFNIVLQTKMMMRNFLFLFYLFFKVHIIKYTYHIPPSATTTLMVWFCGMWYHRSSSYSILFQVFSS